MDAITRKETYLQAVASGDKSDLPTPITREEKLLYEIALRGGGGTIDAETAYQMAVEEGYTGTKEEWISSRTIEGGGGSQDEDPTAIDFTTIGGKL